MIEERQYVRIFQGCSAMFLQRFFATFSVILTMTVYLRQAQSFPANEGEEYACGELLHAGWGVIESPWFPNMYPPEVDCSWIIKTTPGDRIRLVSEYFSVEDQPQCLWDYVAIIDGENGDKEPLLYCGWQQLEFLSTSNEITIHFHTDVSGSDSGFRINYEKVRSEPGPDASCNVTLTEEGQVTSPGYPQPYAPGMSCFYIIKAPSGQQISLEFTEIDIETSPCDFDRLEVYDGVYADDNAHLGTLCGQDLPEPLLAESGIVILRFISDESIETMGFQAILKFISEVSKAPTSPTLSEITIEAPAANGTDVSDEETPTALWKGGCNITITDPVSIITSPDYPNHYPHDTFCVTMLRSDVNSSFLIQFFNFSMEDSEGCAYDSFSIYEANMREKTPLMSLCGSYIDTPIFSWEGQGLDLVFYSDMSVSDSGYLAQVFISPITTGSECPATCENGGTCAQTLLADGTVDWTCVCTEGYTGNLCESVVRDTCDRLVCQNGGVCLDDGDTVACVCPDGYTGQHCQDVQSNSGKALYFTKMATNMSVSVGSNVILECAVSDVTAHVMWLFHDRIMTNSDWSRGVQVHPGGVVVIPAVQDEHSGRYTCMAVTTGDLVEKSIWIHLTEPCSLTVKQSPSNLTVREGQTAMFPCYIPDADVMLWRKDGDIIVQGPRRRILVNNYLVINPVLETDAGQYTCAGRAKSGCFSQVTAQLTVETMGHGAQCGRPRTRQEKGVSMRISNGQEAAEGSAPWHVILREEKRGTTFCGGSLISSDTVLTAGHCIGQFELMFSYPFHPRHIQVYLGTNHCAGHNGIYRQIKTYIVHEQFNNTHYNNDVALLKLDRPVEFSDNVLPICLETPEFLNEILKPGRLGLITGCGGRYAHGLVPTFLHEVQIPYVSPDICRERAASVNTNFTPGMFCAGYARSMRGDACSGDSGGPYVLEFSGRHIQAGIVSWGVGCDRENHYGYYTNLAEYYQWIMDRLGKDSG